MTNLPLIGIDPGISAGCITVLENGVLKTFRMKESFKEIKEILKPFGGSPDDTRIRCSIEKLNIRPMGNPFMNARMEPMRRNFDRLKDALLECNIPFQEVAPATWQKYNNLVLPKGVGEKGLNYADLDKHKKELKHLQVHLSIERNVPNDVKIVNDIRYILETSGKLEARKALLDGFSYFSKYDLVLAIKETEKTIEKFNNQEKRIRKNRYKKRASELAGRKVALWEADAILILVYQKYNPSPKL